MGKVVSSVPHWIVEDAQKQAEWVAEKKKEKAMRDGSTCDTAGNGKSMDDPSFGAVSANAASSSSAPAPAGDEQILYVDCMTCGASSPWPELESGDGVCAACLVNAATANEDRKADAPLASSSRTTLDPAP